MKASIKKKLTVTLFTLSLLINPILGFSKNTTIKTNKLESIKTLKPSEPITEAKARAAYRKLPMDFEINKGQVDDQVKFFSRSGGYTLFLTGEEAVFSLRDSKEKTRVMRMQLSGNKKAEIVGEDELPGKSNYFIGNNSKKWRTDISHYAKVRYKEVYAGIDMVYYGNQNQLEYDFIVKPGAKVEDIKLAYKGADKIIINKQGELILKVGSQEIKQHKPFIYQENEGHKIEIEGNYKVKGKGVGFKVENYDSSKSLIIDPTLQYSTYLGGWNVDLGSQITVDTTGAAYVTGWTTSTDFPIQTAYQATLKGSSQAFVTKLSPDGKRVYSTYLGGSGSNEDRGYGIAVDNTGAAYITGEATSSDFPTQNSYKASNSGGQDVFVTKLNPLGTGLIYSTYLGGAMDDWGYGIGVDPTGAVYVTGWTHSTDFPTQTPFQATNKGDSDSFVTKLSPDGKNLVYSTYLGGSKQDNAYGIAIDSTRAVYVIGEATSSDFPTQNSYKASNSGGQDVFVTKLNPLGTGLIYSTYLGGAMDDWGYGIGVDPTGAAYVTGWTTSTDFPVQTAYQATLKGSMDAFVTKLSPDGKSLVYSTYLGGNEQDNVHGIAVDNTGAAYVTGETDSINFPIQNAYQATLKGAWDAFVTKLSPDGKSLIYSTYLGGSEYDGAYGIAVDNTGSAYVIGSTYSKDFPIQDACQATNNGGILDAFITKLRSSCSTLSLSPNILPNGTMGIAYNQTLTTSGGASPHTYQVTAGTLPTRVSLSPAGVLSGIPIVAGDYSFTVKSVDKFGCEVSQNYTIHICSDCVGVNIAITPSSLPFNKYPILYSVKRYRRNCSIYLDFKWSTSMVKIR